MPLPYRWHGGPGDVLVLIAGLGAKGTSWHPFLETAARSFAVLTFDNPGAGQSPRLCEPVSIADLAGQVVDLLDHLGVRRAHVVGRSMGGMIAQELALLAPERVDRLVLASTTGRPESHLTEVFRLWAQMAALRLPTAIRHRCSLLWCLGDEALASNARVRSYLRARASSDRPEEYALLAEACARHDSLDRLGSLRVPTLVVSGTDDRLMPAANAKALASAIPGSELCWIPGAGHLAYLETPARFAAEVLDFLTHERGARASAHSEERISCPNSSMLS